MQCRRHKPGEQQSGIKKQCWLGGSPGWRSYAIVRDQRMVGDEYTGVVDNKNLFIVYTMRGETVRMISARSAMKKG